MINNDVLNGSHVLVIGGAGFVGSNLVKMLLNESRNVQITVVDNLLSSERDNLPVDDRIHLFETSINNPHTLASLSDNIDYVFHLATFHGNQSSIFDPIKDHENNAMTTLNLYERIKHFHNLKKVVYSSAGCSVAKKTFHDPVATTEESPIELKQDSPYSISKIIGEFYSVYYHAQTNLPTVRVRFQNVYGPGEVLGAGDWRGTYATVWRNVTPTFIYKALSGETLPLENEGIASRDFIYVEDICRGLLLAAEHGVPGEVYNLGSGVQTTIRELAEYINQITKNKAGVNILPRRRWDNSGKRYASTKKSEMQLGFHAEVNIRTGLERTIEWTQENKERIDRCIHKHDAHMAAVN